MLGYLEHALRESWAIVPQVSCGLCSIWITWTAGCARTGPGPASGPWKKLEPMPSRSFRFLSPHSDERNYSTAIASNGLVTPPRLPSRSALLADQRRVHHDSQHGTGSYSHPGWHSFGASTIVWCDLPGNQVTGRRPGVRGAERPRFRFEHRRCDRLILGSGAGRRTI